MINSLSVVLRKTNVTCIIPLLHLMAEGRNKSLVFISTIGVFDAVSDQPAAANLPLQDHPPLESGYHLTKWTVEQILHKACAMGYQVQTLRPGLIIGDSQSGYYNTQDTGVAYLKLIFETRSLPARISNIPLPWVNVDRAAQRILDIADLPFNSGNIAHIFEHSSIPRQSFEQGTTETDIQLEVVPTKDWLERALQTIESSANHPAGWLTPILLLSAEILAEYPEDSTPMPTVEQARSLFPVKENGVPSTCPGFSERDPVDSFAAPIRWISRSDQM